MKPYVNHIKNKKACQGIKSQSAMEYLLTYGWAILVIVIVIISLFKFGIFGNNLAPKAQPGSCYVSKTITGGTLAGSCNGELPEFVAQFNGASSYIALGTAYNPMNYVSDTITMCGWVNSPIYGAGLQFIKGNDNSGNSYGLETAADTFTVVIITSGAYTLHGGTLPLNSWQFICGAISGGNMYTYLNGVQTGSGTYSGTLSSSSQSAWIGAQNRTGYNYWYQGSMANIQIYNASLPATDILALYQEGIGGAPIDTNYLVGWWPLNGNANDYSGNNNNGTPTNVIFNSTWSS